MAGTETSGTKQPAADTVRVKVDGRVIAVPRMMPEPGTNRQIPTTMLRACELAGVSVPHYCYHPKLTVAGNCRMCMVEYGTPAVGHDRQAQKSADGWYVIVKSPRPAIACATGVSEGMEIYTNTPAVRQMRRGVLEFLLINHPLDCPICDQTGECKLQEYAMEYGLAGSRFLESKEHKPKRVELGPRVILDDERCILCGRCTRFSRELAKVDALGIVNRGGRNTLSNYPGRPFDHNYTLNTVDLCPVGALTSRDFRFRMRVWFLKETKSVCATCGRGCNILVGSRENVIYRFTPRRNDAVNECWMCDTGRLKYKWIGREDRLVDCTVRRRGEQAATTSWDALLKELAERLASIRPGTAAIVASARLTNEELYLVRRLADRLGAAVDAVPRNGEADHWMVSADRNPNSLGARLMGVAAEPIGSELSAISSAIAAGTISTLIVLGEDVVQLGFGKELLGKLETLVAWDVLPSQTTEVAHYVLPGCAHVEKCGTFTNTSGRVQRFQKAVEPPGRARPEVETLAQLLGRMGDTEYPSQAEALFDMLAAGSTAFRGMRWQALGDTGLNLVA